MHFRQEYSQYDLESALEHGIDGDADHVIFSHYDEINDHIHLLESLIRAAPSKLTRYPKGWAKDKSEEEILEALVSINETIKSYWQEILEGFNEHSLPPVIVVNKKLCDGAHRTVLSYLFDTPVRVAYFTAPPLEDTF